MTTQTAPTSNGAHPGIRKPHDRANGNGHHPARSSWNTPALRKDLGFDPEADDSDHEAHEVTAREEDLLNGRAGALYEETKRYFRVGNAIFDWQLPMPPAFKLVWLCLLRHANNRKIPCTVAKVSHERLALQCAMDRRVISAAIRYLGAIEAIDIIHRAAAKPDGTRMTWAYYVPPVSSLGKHWLTKRIETVRRKQPHLLRLRPDLRGAFSRS